MRFMQTTAQGWNIIDEQAGVLSLSYSFGAEGQANCFTARMPSGGLMLISPPSRVGDEAMDELDRFGKVEAIVANNGFHHLGISRWRHRHPKARCFAAPGAIERIGKKSKNAGPLEPLSELTPLLGDDVAVVETASSKCGETWAWAKIDGGYCWYASDLLANMQQLPSSFLVRMLFKLTKSAPGYRVFGLASIFILKDKHATFAGMLEDLKAHPPTVMVPAHGDILSGDALAAETMGLVQAQV